MTSNIRLESPDADGVAVLWFDVQGQKVNTLSVKLLPEFDALLSRVEQDPRIKAVVLASAKESGFIAGADLDDLGAVTTEQAGAALSRQGQEVMARMVAVPKPSVAAIHGDCLGGGLEVALSCDARVAANARSTKLGLPEVMLGLLPGAGGTQRLPALIGLPEALDMMLTGRLVSARRALKMGLVDDLAPPNQLVPVARAWARRLMDGERIRRGKRGVGARAQRALLEGTELGRSLVFRKAREKVQEQTHGLMPAPLRILDAVEIRTFGAESHGFGELTVSPESKGLQHLFHCITRLKKDDGPGTAGVDARPVGRVGMVGAGLMGGGIATVLADKGVHVRLKDVQEEGLLIGLRHAHGSFSRRMKRKRLTPAAASERINRVSGGITWDGFGQCDVVIEAVPEKLSLKQATLKEVEERSRRGAVFASNTSSLPIGEIAAHAAHPERVIGMHFFSPVEKMPLVEVIVTDRTAPEVTRTVVELARLMGKHVIVVRDCAGFYTTRALAPYLMEAVFLMLEGVDPADIDEAALRQGFPVGPITLMDEVGIDVGAKVTEVMRSHYGHRMELPDPALFSGFMEERRFGRKVNKGFYRYKDGESVKKKGRKLVDKAIYKLLPAGVQRQERPDLQAVGERLLLALVNEAWWCLNDGVLREPLAGDLGAVMGIGFPPMKGGPFFWTDQQGAALVHRRLCDLRQELGRRFQPCPRLEALAASGGTVHSDQPAVEEPRPPREAPASQKTPTRKKAPPRKKAPNKKDAPASKKAPSRKKAPNKKDAPASQKAPTRKDEADKASATTREKASADDGDPASTGGTPARQKVPAKAAAPGSEPATAGGADGDGG